MGMHGERLVSRYLIKRRRELRSVDMMDYLANDRSAAGMTMQ